MTLTQLEALRPELDAWNARQERVRDEYDAHPTAACMGIRRVDGIAVLCDAIATEGHLCRRCQRDRLAAIKRMQRRRAT